IAACTEYTTAVLILHNARPWSEAVGFVGSHRVRWASTPVPGCFCCGSRYQLAGSFAGVHKYLIYLRRNRTGFQNIFQIVLLEIGDADCTDLARLMGFF